MNFDWPRFLSQHRIHFVTSGPNTARGQTSIQCPWCGDADPSQHMGLSPRGFFGCLRNQAHRGRSPPRLICQLLHCSPEEAQELLNRSTSAAVTRDALAASARALSSEAAIPTSLSLPKEFKPLANGSVLARPFTAYLQERGYRSAQIKWLANKYGLHYATKGEFAGRITIPIYSRYSELVSWTGRTIKADAQPRYKTLRMTGDPPLAKLASNHTLLGLPVLWSAPDPHAIILVEGPFDALKISAFGSPWGVYGAALFGLNVFPSQVSEIVALRKIYPHVFLLLDDDAELQRLRLMNGLRPARVQPLKMPKGTDDPGAMTPAQITELCMQLRA